MRNNTQASVGIGEMGRYLKKYYFFRRNLNKELEVSYEDSTGTKINDKIITEEIRVDMHTLLEEKFGTVSRRFLDYILENYRVAKHIPYEFAPKLGWVQGIRYYVLYETENIVLHECSDKIYRVRQMRGEEIYTTDCGRNLEDALKEFNRISGLRISIYNI